VRTASVSSVPGMTSAKPAFVCRAFAWNAARIRPAQPAPCA
jgi:hypothetical protein